MYPQTTSLVASDVDDVDDQIIFESGQIVFVNFSKKNIPVEIVFEIEYICILTVAEYKTHGENT